MRFANVKNKTQLYTAGQSTCELRTSRRHNYTLQDSQHASGASQDNTTVHNGSGPPGGTQAIGVLDTIARHRKFLQLVFHRAVKVLTQQYKRESQHAISERQGNDTTVHCGTVNKLAAHVETTQLYTTGQSTTEMRTSRHKHNCTHWDSHQANVKTQTQLYTIGQSTSELRMSRQRHNYALRDSQHESGARPDNSTIHRGNVT